MSDSDSTHSAAEHRSGADGTRPTALVGKHRWLLFVLPFAVYMLGNSLEPSPPPSAVPDRTKKAREPDEKPWLDLGIEYRHHYPIVYTAKILATLAAILVVLPGYRQFPFSFSPLAVAVGVVGVFVWVGLCRLGLEQTVLGALGLDWFGSVGARAAFDPRAQLADNLPLAWAFLAVRFTGLILVVPLIEEFFLRGFLMRFLAKADWWTVPFGQWNTTGVVGTTAVAVLMHPAEGVAELVWFSSVTWLMLRRRNIWDCVVAHAVTNGLLGVYVLGSGEWHYL